MKMEVYWHKCFFYAIGQKNQRGHPEKDASTDVEKVHAVITEDQCYTIREVLERVGIRRSAVQRVVSSSLGMSQMGPPNFLLQKKDMWKR